MDIRPRVIIHNAVSLDGRMDHIEVDLELYYSLISTWEEDATMCGSETMLAAMDAFIEAAREDHPRRDDLPLMVVVDGRGRIKDVWAMRRQQYWRDAVVLCCRSTPKEHIELLEREGVGHIIAGEERVDLLAALEELYSRYGVRAVRVDSGGKLSGALLRQKLVDEVSVLILPVLVGGTSPRSIFTAEDLEGREKVIDLELISCERPRDDIIWLRYSVRH
jgi:2,5-diamino-6-(ribosylamino)-4(3H)-pyrimidinone 5'-phosphate reductase